MRRRSALNQAHTSGCVCYSKRRNYAYMPAEDW